MEPHKHQGIVNKLGYDPTVKPKVAVAYELFNTRTNQLIITGPYKLCKWKMKEQQSQNPLSTFRILPKYT